LTRYRTNHLGESIAYTLDRNGNAKKTEISAADQSIAAQQTAVFNVVSELKKSLGNNGQSTSFEYDNQGNVVSNEDALTQKSTQSFDALNRLKKAVDPLLGETSYDYDAQGNLASVTDAESKTTEYQYNAFGNITQLTSPDTGVTTFTYDSAGNLLTKTDARGVKVTFAYDALNRVVSQSYSDSSENITYNYDDLANGNKGVSRLTGVTDQSGTTNYFYNSFGRVAKETKVIAGKSYITEYQFNTYGQLTSITYPSGRILSYSFDNLGRVSGVTSSFQTETETKTRASN
jgi:YD repeat-containing protein